jgi:hypothetical protein
VDDEDNEEGCYIKKKPLEEKKKGWFGRVVLIFHSIIFLFGHKIEKS